MKCSQRWILSFALVLGLGVSGCQRPEASSTPPTSEPGVAEADPGAGAGTDSAAAIESGTPVGQEEVNVGGDQDQPSAEESPYAGPIGIWGKQGERGVPFLELSRDHRLAGSDGCNRIFGTWSQLEIGIGIDVAGSTRMACEGVDTWLLKAKRAQIRDTTLILMDASGAEIGRLTRTR